MLNGMRRLFHGWMGATGRPAVWAWAAAAAICVPMAAQAQLFGRPTTVIENARIVTGDGGVIDGGRIVIRSGRIIAVGANVPVPERARRIDAAGRTVTPGFVDVAGAIGNTSSAGSDAHLRAIDAFDRYAAGRVEEALSHGVTAAYLPARGGAGLNGLGAIVRYAPQPGGAIGEPLVEEAALCIDLGSSDAPVARLRLFDQLRKQFKAAKDYRRNRDFYEEDLEEYEKKIRERAEAAKKEEAKEEKSEGAEQQGGGDKKEEIKKPAEPKYDATSETLLRILDHEMPVRIRAANSEDILNAIELAEEFDIRIVLEHAGEAAAIAGALAGADVAVVLDYGSGAHVHAGEMERNLDRVIRGLDDAGVEWTLGSGGRSGGAARFLLMQAQLASRHNAERDPIDMLTSEAAAFLGVADQVGRIARGLRADLVIWDRDPLDPAARVDAVYVDGQVAWEREEQAGGAS